MTPHHLLYLPKTVGPCLRSASLWPWSAPMWQLLGGAPKKIRHSEFPFRWCMKSNTERGSGCLCGEVVSDLTVKTTYNEWGLDVTSCLIFWSCYMRNIKTLNFSTTPFWHFKAGDFWSIALFVSCCFLCDIMLELITTLQFNARVSVLTQYC